MDFYLNADDHRRGLARALYEQIRQAIAEGRIRPGDRLPPSRELAKQLAISRFTVTTAYGYLVAEGFLEGASAAGTRVTLPARRSQLQRVTPPLLRGRHAPASPAPPNEPAAMQMELGVPDAESFPYTEFRTQTWRAMRELRTHGGTQYGDAAGEPSLRRAIATWIHRSRGVRAAPEEVVVTAGAQQAFDLVLSALARPGDTVAVEDPGYPPFRQLAELRGVKVVPVQADHHGLVVESLPPRARLVYVTPSHQFPLGSVLSLVRRRLLLDWAQATGAFILEDDYDSEFRFSDRPLEPMQRLDTGARVLYIGSFSKSLSPSLRTGFVVAPREVASTLASVRALLDCHSPAILQRTLARFLDDGSMDRHLRRTRKLYRARHQFIVDWFAGPGRTLGKLIAIDAGLHLAAELHDSWDERTLCTRALDAGLNISGLAKFSVESIRPGLTFGYGNSPPEKLEQAFRILKKVLR
ncbi:PLP-dependent aminotransferase family protein [Pendulispora brunnea]|uniref:PLP-dependent aminotransferase family protein n=1 Tax=Pendulispora brunnea TaxID=2905690 RepID=A0ABZ2K9T0_9BACT